MNSKGQTQQLFIFLAAILIIIATIWIGTKLFGGLAGSACGMSDVDFKNAFTRELERYSTFGSRGTLSIDTPCDTVMLCLVDATFVASSESASFDSDDATLNTIIRNGVQTNIFLRKEEGLMEIGYDPRIVVDDPKGYICVADTSQRFVFEAEGGGRFITVRES